MKRRAKEILWYFHSPTSFEDNLRPPYVFYNYVCHGVEYVKVSNFLVLYPCEIIKLVVWNCLYMFLGLTLRLQLYIFVGYRLRLDAIWYLLLCVLYIQVAHLLFRKCWMSNLKVQNCEVNLFSIAIQGETISVSSFKSYWKTRT